MFLPSMFFSEPPQGGLDLVTNIQGFLHMTQPTTLCCRHADAVDPIIVQIIVTKGTLVVTLPSYVLLSSYYSSSAPVSSVVPDDSQGPYRHRISKQRQKARTKPNPACLPVSLLIPPSRPVSVSKPHQEKNDLGGSKEADCRFPVKVT